MADENNTNDNIIVSRMQQRRGLKQDLPQPLRPGEIGVAVDSRQVYIGGDPSVPNAADYNAVSEFENTTNAVNHAISIANNNIIAYTVPFVKFSRSEYNGVTNTKQWTATDARSIIDGEVKPRCYYSSKDFPVFSTSITDSVTGVCTATVTSATEITVSGVTSVYGIRAGDSVTGTGIPTSTTITVTAVTLISSGTYTLSLSGTVSLTENTVLTFVPNSIVNFETGLPFQNDDVVVKCNGVKLLPEANNENTTQPSAVFDYTLDGTDVSASGTHILTLRTRPQPTDEVTICYYTREQLLNAIKGVPSSNSDTLFISSNSDFESFYSKYSIPSYRQLDDKTVYLSEESGLGFIGLQQKHLVTTADGANIATPTVMTFGNLMIQRDDVKLPSTNVTVQNNSTEILVQVNQYETDLSSLSTIGDGGIYRYNKIYLTDNLGQANNGYYYDKPLSIIAVNNSNVTLEVPVFPFQSQRVISTASMTPITTEIQFTGEFEGVSKDDWIRVIDSNAGELHNIVFLVQDAPADNNTTILVNLDNTANVNVSFTSNVTSGLAYVNHGSVLSNINTTFQAYSVEHGLYKVRSSSDNTAQGFVADDVSNVYIVADTSGQLSNVELYEVQPNTANTFMVNTGSVTLSNVDISGTFRPNIITGVETPRITPILSIDLRANVTLAQAVTTVNKPLVVTKDGDQAERILPLLTYAEHDNGERNAVYLTQSPGVSSVDAGGINFTLHEDRDHPTLSSFNMRPTYFSNYNQSDYLPRTYTRNNTVKAKLELWMDELTGRRDINLLSNMFVGGTPYADALLTNNGVLDTVNSNVAGQYNMIIDDTFGEVLFCTREEASNFNRAVNTAYSQSVYDRSRDTQDGTRGLLNLKNNIEIQTKQTAIIANKVLTYVDLETIFIPNGFPWETELFTVGADTYDAFIIDYTISDDSESTNKYSRMGQIKLISRSDFTADTQIVLADDFASNCNLPNNTGEAVLEPQFYAELVDNQVVFKFRKQYANPAVPLENEALTHSLGTSLVMKYVVRRWNSVIY